jgi:hypothetical protein
MARRIERLEEFVRPMGDECLVAFVEFYGRGRVTGWKDQAGLRVERKPGESEAALQARAAEEARASAPFAHHIALFCERERVATDSQEDSQQALEPVPDRIVDPVMTHPQESSTKPERKRHWQEWG